MFVSRPGPGLQCVVSLDKKLSLSTQVYKWGWVGYHYSQLLHALETWDRIMLCRAPMIHV